MGDGEELPYEVKYSIELGRYLVAVRDILPREIIIREDPLISGPSDRGPKDFPVCLGCSATMIVNRTFRCSTCHWPVCNEECEKLPPHASNECQIFRRNRVMYPPPYGWPVLSKSILILRCLLMKSQKPQDWDRLMNMSDNKDFRKGRPNCINSDKKIVENFRRFFNEDCDCNKGRTSSSKELELGFSEEEVIRISGIIDVNAHAFPLKVNGRSTYVCNLYSRTSLMAHSCTPNASWSPDKSLSSLTLTIRANVPIAKGDMICVAYDEGQLLVCTLKRLIPNEINGMFVCKCRRCVDRTELGTYIGALKCPSCSNGYLLPTEPTDSFSSWKCDNGEYQQIAGTSRSRESSKNCDDERGNGVSLCNAILDDESVIEIMQDAEVTCGYTKIDLGTDPPPPEALKARNREEERDETLDLLKEFEKDYAETVLHPNHYILLEVNVRILKREYKRILGNLEEGDLIQYLERCERLLKISNVLTPGFCEYRAFLQYHFSQGLLALERRRERNGKTMMKQNHRRRRSQDKQGNIQREGDNDENKGDDNISCSSSSGGANTGAASDGDGGDDNDESISGETMKDCCVEGPYGSSRENLEKLLEMLSFLMTFFKEINPSHKLLKPISDTLTETEKKVKLWEEEESLSLEK